MKSSHDVLRLAALGLAALCAPASAAPSVDGVVVHGQDAFSGRVAVDYSLSGGPAIVTVEFATNGVALPASAHTFLLGDVNKVVTNAACSFTWDPRRAWPGHDVGESFTAKVTAHTFLDPPEYCAIDLTRERDAAANHPMYFYTGEDAVPGGVTNEVYKRSAILLRKIPRTGAQGFVMGSPEWEEGREQYESPSRESPHRVVLTRDFYIGVYEITQEQYRRVIDFGDAKPYNKTAWKGRNYTSMSPVNPMEQRSYEDLRGSGEAYDWPSAGSAVDPALFFGVLRAKTGGAFLWDLPTEAQWEYACRGGSMAAFHDGTAYRAGAPASAEAAVLAAADEISWNLRNAAKTTREVGTRRKNTFGLYDMHGNVTEWCRDWMLRSGGKSLPLPDAVDPAGAASSDYRVGRGGRCDTAPKFNRAARRAGHAATTRAGYIGFRLSATIGESE